MKATERGRFIHELSDPRFALRVLVEKLDSNCRKATAGKIFLCAPSNGYMWKAQGSFDGKGHLNIRIKRGEKAVSKAQSQPPSLRTVFDPWRALGVVIKTFDLEHVTHSTGKVFKRLTFSSCGYDWRAEAFCDRDGRLNIRIVRKEMVPHEITREPIRDITSEPIRKITTPLIRKITQQRIG